MPRNVEPLSAAQIHSVYAPKDSPKTPGVAIDEARYSKTSVFKREPGHSGRTSSRPDLTNKQKKY